MGDAFGKPNHFPSEVYAPTTGTWTITAKMNEDRQNYTMTMLPDGTVLASGGIDWSSDTTRSTAEIYHPSSDTWTVTTPLDRPRFRHMAVSLPDGRVMVIGGGRYPEAFDTLVSVVIFDPTTSLWTAAPTMRRTYEWTGIVTLDGGEVLVLGRGADSARMTNREAEATAEIYAPSTNTWRTAAAPLHPRMQHPLVKMRDGRILAVAGSIAQHEESTRVDLYDPRTDRWTELEPALVPRRNHGAALLPSGSVVVMGGSNLAESYLSSAELFTPCP